MLRIYLLFTFLFVTFQMLFAQNEYPNLDDESDGIINGYGSWGANNVIRENTLDLPDFDGNITFYHPDIIATQLPTIFFISGWGRDVNTYDKFFRFIASQGYPLVHIYNNNPGNIATSYTNAKGMIEEAAELHYSNWINTSKIGLMGHSFGAGATVWIGKELFDEAKNNWGTEGRFIFMTAPWFSLMITPEELQNYPENVKLLIEINNDDLSSNADYTWNTDERAIRAVYQLINIPNDEKDLARVYSSPETYQYNGATYTYDANHYISYSQATSEGVYQPYDALDVFAINRLSNALIEYTFNGDTNAKNVALGNGSAEQKDMGFLTDLAITDTPIVTRAETEYAYKCTTGWNDFEDSAQVWYLQDYCEDNNNDGMVDVLPVPEFDQNSFEVYPIPTSSLLTIRLQDETESIHQIIITDNIGKKIQYIRNPTSNTIDVSKLTTGVYFIKIMTEKKVSIRRFIVE